MPLATEEYTDPECNVCGAIIHNSFEQNDDREAIQSSIYQHYNYTHSDIKNSKQLAEQQIYDQFTKTNVSDPFLEESKSDIVKDFAEKNDVAIYDASDFQASSISDAIKIANQHGLECPRCHEKAVWSPVIPEMLCTNCGYKYSIESKASEYVHLESLPDHFGIDDDREDDIMGGWASADVIVCNYCEKKFDLEDSNGERDAIRHLKIEHGITESKAKEGAYSKMREIANKEWQDMDEQQRYNILHQSRNYDTDRMAKDAVESEDLDELKYYVFNMDALIDALLPFPIEDYTDESKASEGICPYCKKDVDDDLKLKHLKYDHPNIYKIVKEYPIDEMGNTNYVSLEMLKQIEKPHEVVAMRNIGVYGSDGGMDEDVDDLIATLEDGLNDVEGEDRQRMLKAIEEGEASLSDPTDEEESEFGFSISDKLQDEVDEAEQEPFDLKADSTAFSDLKSIRKKQRESEIHDNSWDEQLATDQTGWGKDDDPTDNSIPKTDKEMAEDEEPPDMATAIKRLQEESHMCTDCMKSFIDGREAQALEVNQAEWDSLSLEDRNLKVIAQAEDEFPEHDLSIWEGGDSDWNDLDNEAKTILKKINLNESKALEGSDNVPASGRVEDILLMNPNARVEGLKGIRWLLRREGYTDKQIDRAVNESPILTSDESKAVEGMYDWVTPVRLPPSVSTGDGWKVSSSNNAWICNICGKHLPNSEVPNYHLMKDHSDILPHSEQDTFGSYGSFDPVKEPNPSHDDMMKWSKGDLFLESFLDFTESVANEQAMEIEFQYSEPKDWNMEVSPNEVECPDCEYKTSDLEELEDHLISHDPHYVGV